LYKFESPFVNEISCNKKRGGRKFELSIAALVQVKMSSNFNCSYMARSSLTNIPFFSVKFNFGGMVIGWPPSEIVSGDPDFQPRWPPS
jgi:hypothetical protein